MADYPPFSGVLPGSAAALAPIVTGWTDDGVVVRLTTATDRVSIGDNVGDAAFKLTVFGDAGESGVLSRPNAATDIAFAAYLAGDAAVRFRVGNGVQVQAIEFGGGALAPDTAILRQAANTWETGTGDSMFAVGAAIGRRAASGDANPTAQLTGSQLDLGAGGAAAVDWTLARNAAGNRADLGANDELSANGTGFLSVRAALADANPTAALDTTRLRLGLSSADALSWALAVGTVTNRADMGGGDFLDAIGAGRLEHRTAAVDANPTVQVGASALLLGAGGATALDTRITRSAAATLTVDNGAAGAVTVLGGADGLLVFGTTTIRNADVVSNLFRVFAVAADANPTAVLDTSRLRLGLNTADALSWALSVGTATNRADMGTGDSLNAIGAGRLEHRTVVGDANPSVSISSNLLEMGVGGATATDVALRRGAVDRWEAGSGDSFDVIAGGAFEHRTLSADANATVQATAGALLLGVGGVTALDTRIARSAAATLRLDNGALGALTVLGGADNVLTYGTATIRNADSVSVQHRVFAAAGDANASAVLDTGALRLGVGGVTALDTRITRTAASTLTMDNNAGGSLSVIGGADAQLILGTSANRCQRASVNLYRTFTAAGDANPTFEGSASTLRLGLNTADNLSWSLAVGTATNRADMGANDEFGANGTGAFSVRNALADANPTVRLTDNSIQAGVNSADALSCRLFAQAASTWETGAADSLFAVTAALGVRALSGDANPTARLTGSQLDLGPGGGVATDVTLSRSAANTLQIAATVGTIPSADGGELGSATARWDVRAREVWAAVTEVTNAMSPYLLAAGDYELHVDTSGGAVTIDLTAAASNRERRVVVKKRTADANAVTIDASGAETIDTLATATLAGGSRGSVNLTGPKTGTDWAIT